MQRIGPRPFNGLFDEIPYDHPAFVPLLSLTCVLLALVVFVSWALVTHPHRRASRGRDRRRGFRVIQ
jgi:hypothetical protein